jgi:hypothetical protein
MPELRQERKSWFALPLEEGPSVVRQSKDLLKKVQTLSGNATDLLKKVPALSGNATDLLHKAWCVVAQQLGG